jgi:transcriptional regulator with XRE-family HTH domain
MKFSPDQPETALLKELGARLEQARLRSGLSQLDLAAAAGVAKRTVERFEAGQPGSTENFMRLLRALGLVERLDELLPQVAPSPMEQLKPRQKRRKRASTSNKEKRPSPVAAKWTWGDEQ